VPARPPLSRDAIVKVALDIISTEGTAAVSMRRVADHFHTGPASLYAHVDSREDLLMLAFDAVAAQVHRPKVDPARWREQLVAMLTESRTKLTSHGDIAVMSIGRIPTYPHSLDLAETMIALLAASGMAEQDIALAADLLPLYLTAVAYEEGLVGLGEANQTEAYFEHIRSVWTSLPPERYPTMVALSPAIFSAGDGDERFRFGLEVLLDGLVGRAKAAGRATKAGKRKQAI
jgi:AcrR family transcriptional regulator